MNKKILALAVLGVVGFGVALANLDATIIIKLLYEKANISWGLGGEDNTTSYELKPSDIDTTKVYWLNSTALVEGNTSKIPENAEPILVLNLTNNSNKTDVLAKIVLSDSQNTDKCILHIVEKGANGDAINEKDILNDTPVSLCPDGGCDKNKTWYGYIEFVNRTACRIHLNITLNDTGVPIE